MRHSQEQSDGAPLTAAQQRELDAIEAALAGETVPDDLSDLASLTQALRDEAPKPSDQLLERLDTEALERRKRLTGIRESRLGSILAGQPGGERLLALRERIGGSGGKGGDGTAGSGTSSPGRRRPSMLGVLAPAGGVATVIIAVVVAVGSSNPGEDQLAAPTAVGPNALEDSASQSPVSPAGEGFGASSADESAGGGSAESSAALDSQTSSRVFKAKRDGVVRNRDDRKQSKAASLTLSTEPDRVPGIADQVIGISDRLGGVVSSSNVSLDPEFGARAQIELELPSEKLSDALSQLSDLASVEARNEAVTDITAPFVSAQDELADARDQRKALLEALASAATEDEAAGIQNRIDKALKRIARAKADLSNISRQARLSKVSVTVVGNGEFSTDDGSWGIGDAADDAVHVLRVGAGVALVSLAVLALIAIPVGLLVLGWSQVVRRRRENALDE